MLHQDISIQRPASDSQHSAIDDKENPEHSPQRAANGAFSINRNCFNISLDLSHKSTPPRAWACLFFSTQPFSTQHIAMRMPMQDVETVRPGSTNGMPPARPTHKKCPLWGASLGRA